MHIYLGADHRGIELKKLVINWLSSHMYTFTDFGPSVFDAEDDYNDYAKKSHTPSKTNRMARLLAFSFAALPKAWLCKPIVLRAFALLFATTPKKPSKPVATTTLTFFVLAPTPQTTATTKSSMPS